MMCRLLPVGLLCLVLTARAEASLALVSNAPACDRTQNLVVNGSFENGITGTGLANSYLWATGTTQNFLPFAVPAGWTSSGQPNSYAMWGSDDNGPPTRLRGSDILPHGQAAMYFGNGGGVQSNMPPTFHNNGAVTFSGSPSFAVPFGGPVVLSQTINTPANPAPSYCLSFWISGEGAGSQAPGPSNNDGIFGFRMTNVLAGNPMNFLTAPSGQSLLGQSLHYSWSFSPLNPSLPVTIEFYNWGHFDLSPYGFSGATTELVMDDVFVNTVPEPTTLGLLLLAAAGLASRRK